MQDTQLFPNVHDTCGDMYVMEHVNTLQENVFLPHTMGSNDRILKAIDIIKYVQRLDSAWPEVLHLCDVKMAHFGWTADGKVKFVDVDSVMTDTLLQNTVGNTPHCESDEDCTFFDCVAECDLIAGKCRTQRKNTNLQVTLLQYCWNCFDSIYLYIFLFIN